ncbi:hypothetical protein BDB01DRAFT_773278 [Pilobolus umbonatus]|nr:hypothetical protein BDB01DRAFT_773278 [Pilobolus umbonatus]
MSYSFITSSVYYWLFISTGLCMFASVLIVISGFIILLTTVLPTAMPEQSRMNVYILLTCAILNIVFRDI